MWLTCHQLRSVVLSMKGPVKRAVNLTILTPTNRCVILASRPTGVAQAENFAIVTQPLPPLAPGQVRIRTAFLSVEPAMRGWIADAGNYAAPVPIGGVMRALASGHVVDSASPDYVPGDTVTGWFGWQELATVDDTAIIRRIEPDELSLCLGVLGLTGVTAYLALTGIGQPKPGETVLVSTAAGAVGSAVGQIAKLLGCRTIGIAGGAEKVAACLSDFGYDAALDYRAPGWSEQIAPLCPKGIDIYFDNTSGPISDAVLPHLAVRARVVVCGTAAIQQWSPWPTGPRVERHLLVKRARMEGFVMFDHMDRLPEAVAQLRGWIAAGRLTYREDIRDGLEACPDALASLYRGENTGKLLIRLPQA
jgi:NADPH-dependent curcumin reductase CurA